MGEPLTVETIRVADIEALRNWSQLVGDDEYAKLATEALTRYRDCGVKQRAAKARCCQIINAAREFPTRKPTP